MSSFLGKITFSKKQCDELLLLNAGFKTADTIKSFKYGKVTSMSKYGKVTSISKLENIILPKVKKWGIFTLKNSSPMFIKYSKGDEFKKHIDSNHGIGETGKRVFTLTIQLSDSSDYTGGDFNVYPHKSNMSIFSTILKERGTMAIFKAEKIHEITKLESGNRKSIVCFPTKSDITIKKTSIL